MSNLKSILNLKINKVNSIMDYLQIFISDNFILNIYNNYKYTGKDFSALADVSIKKIDEKNSVIHIYFTNGEILSVSLLDKDYNGPEAMQLIYPDKKVVIWN